MITFRTLDFPVRLHFSFFIVALFFVIDSGLSAVAIVLWMVAAGASVLLHEFGHALTVRRFGGRVENVTLHLMGGYTQWRPGSDGPFDKRKRFLVSAAGSGLEIAVGVAVFYAARAGVFGEAPRLFASSIFSDFFWVLGHSGEYVAFSVQAFVWVSIFWGLINWVPVGGLDGSRMLREFWTAIDPVNGERHTRIVGIVLAVVLSFILWSNGYRFAPLIFLFYAFSDLMGTRIRVD